MKLTCYRCKGEWFSLEHHPLNEPIPDLPVFKNPPFYDPKIEKYVCWYCNEPTNGKACMFCEGCSKKDVELAGPNGLFQCLNCKK